MAAWCSPRRRPLPSVPQVILLTGVESVEKCSWECFREGTKSRLLMTRLTDTFERGSAWMRCGQDIQGVPIMMATTATLSWDSVLSCELYAMKCCDGFGGAVGADVKGSAVRFPGNGQPWPAREEKPPRAARHSAQSEDTELDRIEVGSGAADSSGSTRPIEFTKRDMLGLDTESVLIPNVEDSKLRIVSLATFKMTACK